jgi:hypothetical protein
MTLKKEQELSKLNRARYISAPNNSVNATALVLFHHPKSEEELVRLIAYHKDHKCECGLESKGTVWDFGKKLFDAQKPFFGEYRYSLADCTRYEYEIFIRNPLKGKTVENKCLIKLNSMQEEGFYASFSNDFKDIAQRPDIDVIFRDKQIAGIKIIMFEDERPTTKSNDNRYPKILTIDYDGYRNRFVRISELMDTLRLMAGLKPLNDQLTAD